MAGMIDISRDATTGLWTLAPKADRNWGSPVIPESLRREAVGQTLNYRRLSWIGSGQAFEVTFDVVNIRGEDNIDGLMQAFVADVSNVREFIFQWPQRINGTGTDGGLIAARSIAGDNEVVFNAVVPPPSVGRLLNFGDYAVRYNKMHIVEEAPVGPQTANYRVRINPPLYRQVNIPDRINAHQPRTRALLLVKPSLPTASGVEFRATLTVREQPPE